MLIQRPGVLAPLFQSIQNTSSGFPVGTVAPVWGTGQRFLSAWLTAAVLVLEYSLIRGRNPFESGSPTTP